jgi:hypothetical protein
LPGSSRSYRSSEEYTAPRVCGSATLREKITMGKIVNSTFVSLDGVINHMDRWHFDFVDDGLARRTP